jgi:pimeloyl-ACP methyl ester carboxylesterase
LLAGLARGAGVIAGATGSAAAASAHAVGSGLAAAADGIQRFVASRFPMSAAVARGFSRYLSQRGRCDSHAPAADGTGGSDHRVMIVAGLDSSITNGGPSTALPAGRLGYEAKDVSYFSYARDGGDYAAADTEGSLRTAARRLGAQLRELERREPGREVDLIGHSQGGVVMTEFLLHVYHPSDPSYPPLGVAVAMASPLGGATGATVEGELNRSAVGKLALQAAHAAGAPDPNARSLGELNKRSDFSRDNRSGQLPPMIDLTSIGATQDVIAPAVDTARREASRFTVTPHRLNGHSGIITDDSALRATRAAIEGKQLPCQSLTTILTGEIVSTAIATAERRIGDIGTVVAAGSRR